MPGQDCVQFPAPAFGKQSYRATDDIREWKNWPELTGAFRTRINLRDVDGNINEEE